MGASLRSLLRRVGLRYGIGISAIVVVVVIIVIARALGGTTNSLVTSGAAGGLLPSGSPAPDDGAESVPAPKPPITSPGTSSPQAVAAAFAAAWLHHTGVTATGWRAALAQYATDRLSGELAQADPQTVPADRVTGAVTLVDHATTYVEADVPTDAGTLVLSLLATDGRWRVDAIDWSPG
jgi:hypothetical protein